jgi:hypothetical protein
MLPFFAAISILAPTALPEQTYLGYSGIPSVTGTNLVVQSHTVSLTLHNDHVDVSSLTLVKNNGPAGTCEIDIPSGGLRDAPAPSGFVATWANAPVTLTHLDGKGLDTAKVPLKYLGSYALRIHYSEPIGKCGFAHDRLIAAYSLQSDVPIGTLMVTYAYAPGVVFHLPEAGPKLGWQVGQKGAFVKLTNYDGKTGLTYCAFYPAGFGSE